MKQFKLIAAILFSLSFSACGGGDDSQSDTGSVSGTGFLKIDFPSLEINGTAALTSPIPTIDHRSVEPAQYMVSTISNDNTEDSCQGIPSNIPFLVCMVESYGINSVGTYSGTTPGGDSATAVVSALSGDPDGYTLEARVTYDSSSEAIFNYKANANGDKGIIEAHPQKIFGSEIESFPYGVRLEWDKTQSPALLQISYDGSTTGDLAFTELNYLVALVDETEGVSDLSYKNYRGDSSFVSSSFTQIRYNSDRILSLTAQCSNTSSPSLGTDCFTFSETTLFDTDTDGNHLECFNASVLADGSIPLSIIDSIALTDTSAGTMAASASYSDSSCESLSTANANGSNFSIRIDKDDAPGNTLNGINHSTRARTFSEMQILSNGSFLSNN